MGRASKFAFTLPGRRAHGERGEHRTPSAVDHDCPQPTKAERLLGTGLPGRHNASQTSVNNAGFPLPPAEETLLAPPQAHFHQHQHQPPISAQGRSGSVASSTYNKILNARASTSTLRSHYDAHRQPSFASQQSSVSVGALRAGHPSSYSLSLSPDQESLPESSRNVHFASDAGSVVSGKRKKTPARLDISKLFPKAPKSKPHDRQHHSLSPTNVDVNTPTQFPPPSISPTASQATCDRALSISSATSDTLRQGRAQAAQDRANKPRYDNAKVNRRRPPPGIQHWFDGLSDDEEDEAEDEDESEESQPMRADARVQEPRSYSHRQPSPPRQDRKSSRPGGTPAERFYQSPHEGDLEADHMHALRRAHSHDSRDHKPHSPRDRADGSQASVQGRSSRKPHVRGQPSQTSLVAKSVLSLSSSDEDSDPQGNGAGLTVLRDSLAVSTDTEGEIHIGKAQALEIRPRQQRLARRMTSASGTTVSSSATGATIDVMLSPTAASASSPTSLSLPRHSTSRNRRSSRHFRQVSAIPEHDDNSSRRYSNISDASSIRSGTTSRSEPRQMGHRLMAVTEEEEVLLELMRRKRAAMAKQSYTDGYRSALLVEHARSRAPESPKHPHHTLSMEGPAAERTDEQQPVSPSDRRPSSTNTFRSRTPSETDMPPSIFETLSNATYVPPSPSDRRGRQPSLPNDAVLDSSVVFPVPAASSASSSAMSAQKGYKTQRVMSVAPQLSPAIFSPLEFFPSPPDSPTLTATASHTDTIPSPITPGPVSDGRFPVKVVGSSIGSSEASFSADHDFPSHGEHKDAPKTIKVETIPSDHAIERVRSHSRQRTASSGANVSPCAEPAKKLAAPQAVFPPRTTSYTAFPKPAASVPPDDVHSISSLASNSRRTQVALSEWNWDMKADAGAVATQVRKSRSSHLLSSPRESASSIAPGSLPVGSPANASKQRTSRQSSIASHVSSKSAAKSEKASRLSLTPMSSAAIAQRSSVCDDVLAAWSSLGGSRAEFYA